jgi:hypothetical protein
MTPIIRLADEDWGVGPRQDRLITGGPIRRGNMKCPN